MTVPAPTSPQPTPTARWNGRQWFDWINGIWVPVAAGVPPTVPQLPQDVFPPAPTPPRPTGTFKDYNTPRSGGAGPYWKFNGLPIGTRYWGIVARKIREKTDVVAVTDAKGVPKLQNGQYQYQLEVPFLVLPDAGFPDGRARMGFKSDSRDKLSAGMEFVGAPEMESGLYVPEEGAFIQVTKVGERVIPGWSNAIIYDVIYRRPEDPWTITKRQEIEEAHQRLAENPIQPAGPPPQPVYDPTTRLWVLPQQQQPVAVQPPAQVPPPVTPSVPPPAGMTGTAPAQPAAPVSGPAAATQAAAAYVTTADTNGQPAPSSVPPPVPPPATSAPVQGPASQHAGSPAQIPGISLEQWEKAPPEARGALEAVTGQRCPATGRDGQPLEVIRS